MLIRIARLSIVEAITSIACIAVAIAILFGIWASTRRFFARARLEQVSAGIPASRSFRTMQPGYEPRAEIDTSGFMTILSLTPKWGPDASLEEISNIWRGIADSGIAEVDRSVADTNVPEQERGLMLLKKANLLNSKGEAEKAYQVLQQLRTMVERDEKFAARALATVIYAQGVTALRRGENDNCIMCRGESSCILPVAPAAVHTNPTGSRLAIEHFTEYLRQFSTDKEVCWLLNVAHMTLGEYPDRVDPRFRLDLSHFLNSEFDIGKFRDVGHLVGVNRFNHAGGAVMDDFDNDGLLDLFVTSVEPTQPSSYYRNKGDSKFEERSQQAGILNQLGGLVCYQADYDDDGFLDLFIVRGAWLSSPIRPSLLRNNRTGGFTDVTKEAGVSAATNSNAGGWADYDNDGKIDFFIGGERQLNLLYHNKGDGTFEDVAVKAGLQGDPQRFTKGCAWIDYDNDGYPDLLLNNHADNACLYHNNRDGSFSDVTLPMGVTGPRYGFSCWAWDYNNDGWLDIFATSFDRSLGDLVGGLIGWPHSRYSSRLFRNMKGVRFDNVGREAGLDMVFATMGSNFGDFDNDGWLDMYLGTGDPGLATLVPNRMFKNVGGERFSEITASSGTGHLQKGHGVACGDWDRDGDVDLFVETGGAVTGDRYHNILFQNPGQGNHWLTVKLVGKKTNRAAIGARIKVVTTGEKPLTVHRHVSSGSSFGGNTLQQTIGLGTATRVAEMEIHWPTSGTTQVLRDIPADQAIEVTEFADGFRPLNWKPLPQPE
jgi:ASPIC and UnbV/FG-GAP-like repeat